MKKLLIVLLCSSTLTSTYAGDKEWATVGKVLTGVAAVQVIDRIVNPPTQVVYVQAQPVVYTQPAVVVQPQPVVYVQPQPVIYIQSGYYCPPPVVVYRYGHHHFHRR